VGGGGEFTKTALVEFAKIVLFGSTFGFTFAHALNFSMNKKWIPHYLLNVFSLAAVLGVFVLSDSFAHESGLLAVVVMGMVLGNSDSPYLKELLYFKESLSILLISILFILLSANINMEELYLIYNWKTALLFALVVFVIRPIGVFLSTYKSSLNISEKLFISWVGPRGIVAAGIASLFGIKLAKEGIAGAEYITPLVFMIVLGTVLLNATTALFFAKIVGVFLKKSEGILIVGASGVSRLIAQYLHNNDRHVVLIDSNKTNIKKAEELGIEALVVDIYSNSLEDDVELNDMGYVMALTGSSDINKYAINKFKEQFGENGAFRLITSEEMKDIGNSPREGLFSHTDDFVMLTKVATDYPLIHELEIHDKEHYNKLIEITNIDLDNIPLFIKDSNGELEIISSYNKDKEIVKKGCKLVYLGKEIEEKKNSI